MIYHLKIKYLKLISSVTLHLEPVAVDSQKEVQRAVIASEASHHEAKKNQNKPIREITKTLSMIKEERTHW